MPTATTTKKATATKIVPLPPKAKKAKDKAKMQTPSGVAFAAIDVVPDWDQVPELVELSFADLAEKRQKMYDEMKFRQEKLKELDEELLSMLAVAGLEKVVWQDRPVQIVHSKSGDKIVGEKLLMLGVAADTIRQATEQGKSYDYLLFGRPAKK